MDRETKDRLDMIEAKLNLLLGYSPCDGTIDEFVVYSTGQKARLLTHLLYDRTKIGGRDRMDYEKLFEALEEEGLC